MFSMITFLDSPYAVYILGSLGAFGGALVVLGLMSQRFALKQKILYDRLQKEQKLLEEELKASES